MTEILSKILPIMVDENAHNVLDGLHNYTYNWRFFMVNELQLKVNDYDTSKVQQITLAETGKTSIFIDTVNMDVMYAPNESTLSAGRITTTITIMEPHGANFLDLIYTAAANLRIQNWSKIPFYLELTFTGYDQEGNIRRIAGRPDPWMWRFQVTSIETEIDEGGSRYTLNAYSANDLAIAEQYGILPKAFQLESNTFLGMMQSLEDQWNEFEQEKNKESIAPLTQYKFIFYEDPGNNPSGFRLNWKDINVKSYNAEAPSRKRVYTSGNPTEKAAFTQGYRVQKIIDSILSASDLSEKLKQYYPASFKKGEYYEELDNVSKTYRMETSLIYTTYDILSNDYEKLIVYHIWPYDGLSQIITPATANGSVDGNPSSVKQSRERAVAERMVKYYQDQRIIRRVYNYLFTGKNTDVLSIDLKYNNIWSAFLAEFAKGPSKQVSIESRDLTTPEQRAQFKAFVSELAKHQDNTEQLVALSQNTQNQIKEYREKAEKLKVEAERARKSDPQLAERRDAAAAAATLRADDLAKLDILNITRNAANEQNTRRLENLRVNARYAEDLSSEQQPITPTIIPVSINAISTKSAPVELQGIESHFYEGSNFLGALLNQMYSTRGSDWMQLRMDIRGDPHWLGFDQISKHRSYYQVIKSVVGSAGQNGRAIITKGEGSENKVIPIENLPTDFKAHIKGEPRPEPHNSPRYEIAEQAFIANFYTPSIFRDTDEFASISGDGSPKVHKKSAFISGIYAVYKISHKFEGGLFTQSIEAKRDPHTCSFQLDEYPGNLDAAIAQRAAIRSLEAPSTAVNAQPIQQKDLSGISKGPNPDCTNLGCRNNNPGNLRGQYFGAVGSNKGFAVYQTPEEGVAAMSQQLDRYFDGKTTGTRLVTTEQIINTYAPSGENDTGRYINTVANNLGISPTQPVPLKDPNFKARFMAEMIKVESGKKSGYDENYIYKVIKKT